MVEEGIFILSYIMTSLSLYQLVLLNYGVQFQCIIMKKTKVVEDGIFTLWSPISMYNHGKNKNSGRRNLYFRWYYT